MLVTFSILHISVQVHEVWVIAASLAFHKNVGLSNIMSSVRWHCDSNFSSFYLCILFAFSAVLHMVSPILAAQPDRVLTLLHVA